MSLMVRCFLAVVVLVLTAGPALQASALVSHERAVFSSSSDASSGSPWLELLAYGAIGFGAIRIKDVGTLANKFAQRAAAAATDYKDGVAQAGGDWESNTAASEAAYEQGVQEALGRKAFGKGVRATGAAHYVKRATELGSQRFAPGVQAGKDRWAANTAPALQVIANLNLPPKGARRSPQNLQRSAMVATALGAWKTSR